MLMRPNKLKSRPAAHRVWEHPPVVAKILEAAAPRDHRSLAAVSKTFYAAVNRPSMWARKYAPSQIDFQNRQVLTAVALPKVKNTDTAPCKRPLGVFDGASWQLSTGYEPALPDAPEHLKRLDEVCERVFFSWDFGPQDYFAALGQACPNEAEQATYLRQQTHLFLLKRGYERHHGTAPKDVFERSTLAFWPAAGILTYTMRQQIQCIMQNQASVASQMAMALLLPEAITLLLFVAFFTLADAHPLTDFIQGPLKFAYLNRQADFFYDKALHAQSKEP